MLFDKKIVVGVSVSPELGLEIAQIDYDTKTIEKYSNKPLAYDNNTRDIADIDKFMETLETTLQELGIPAGSEIVLNIPSVIFNVQDYKASIPQYQVEDYIDEDLMENPFFKNQEIEPCIASALLPNSTIQSNKYVYEAAQKVTLTEIAMRIAQAKYKLVGIDTSVSSTINALIYNDRLNTNPNEAWVILLVENNCCRVIQMAGINYSDYYEERISIAEVLGDEENYETVLNAVQPILKNVPGKCLYIISKTNVIRAKTLAEKIEYKAQIIHQEANFYAESSFVNVAPDIDENTAKTISLDVIGAAIYKTFNETSTSKLNLFNKSLGDVYTSQQPPVIKIGEKSYELSLENTVKWAIIAAIPIIIALVAAFLVISNNIKTVENEINNIDREISDINSFLEANKDISADSFDESAEIKIGLKNNQNIYNYYTIVGTEIPQKLWLTHLHFGDKTIISGQADNIESIYGFFRNIKDYNPDSDIKLQKLGLAAGPKITSNIMEGGMDAKSILTSLNADFYEFIISNDAEVANESENKNNNNGDNNGEPPNLEPLE